jgi:tRNA dimethylallyltransferase
MKKLITITGPTASGKTSLSLKTANWIQNAEIISADSRQVYKYMNIGTDKVKDQKNIPHHLISFIEPDQTFTAGQFKKIARKKINNILKRNNIPLLCGGTWFYLRAVIDGLVLPQVAPDWDFREKKSQETTKKLFRELKEKDPRRAENIDENNKRRLIRALEIIKTTEKPVPKLKKDKLPYPILILGIKSERKKAFKKIDRRVEEMITEGLEEEAKGLLEKYNKTPQETIGYSEWDDYFKGKKEKKEVIEEIKLHTKQYYKEQLKWYKNEKRITWVKNFKEAKEEIKKYL